MSSIAPKIARRLALELAVWFGMAGSFLAIYVTRFDAPTSAVAPHLRFVGMLVATLFIVRYSFARWLPARAGHSANTVTSTFFLVILSVYYIVTLVGLDSWGRVISWSLITTYSAQIPELLDALGIPAATATLVAGLLGLVALLGTGILLRRDWISASVQFGSHHAVGTMLLLIVAALGIESWRFIEAPPADAGEPVALTFHPELGTRQLQGSAVSRNTTQFDKHEERVRTSYIPASTPPQRNVIIIVADALRADHLSFNGYPRSTTPFLEQLDRQGHLLHHDGMYSACAESSCGLMALSASRYVHQFVSHPFSLQEVLRRHGYRAHMILGGDHTNFYGLREAYGELDSYYDGSMARGQYMNDDQLVIDALSRFDKWDGTPALLQFHLMSTHGASKRESTHSPFQPARSYYADIGQFALSRNVAPEDKYTNFYDNGIVRADATIRELLAILQSKGYMENALVIITADHGEMLGEQGKFSHSKGLFDPVLRIPFLMVRSGYHSPAEIPRNATTSQIDIAPTILAELSIPIPESWKGNALQNIPSGNKREYVFFQQSRDYGLIDLRSTETRWKYWVDAKTNGERAYDLAADPGERINRQQDIPANLRAEWKRKLSELQAYAHTLTKDEATHFVSAN